MNAYYSFNCFAILRLQGYDRFRLPWWWAILGIGILLITITFWRGALWFVRWLHSPITSTDRLLSELLRVKKLGSLDRKRMIRILNELPKPSRTLLFVDPELWPWNSEELVDLADEQPRLYEKIFGVPPQRTKDV